MTDITFDPDGPRYVLPLGDEEAEVTLSLTGAVMTIRRVFVPPAHEGQGLAARLMAHVARDARDRGLKIVPVCSYAAAWFRRHPDQRGLLA
jgi:uncharacterized protein